MTIGRPMIFLSVSPIRSHPPQALDDLVKCDEDLFGFLPGEMGVRLFGVGTRIEGGGHEFPPNFDV